MVWQFVTDLLRGVFWSLNGITTWIGIVSFLFFFFPQLEGKMKDKLSTIRPYRLSILMAFILISVILTSYSMYKDKQQEINKLQGTLTTTRNNLSMAQKKIDKLEYDKLIANSKPIFDEDAIFADTKQDIRTLLEFISPRILDKIDAKEKKIGVWFDPISEGKLLKLSERKDFKNFLSFEKKGNTWTVAGKGTGGEELYGAIRGIEESGTLIDYYLYPKDALRK
jgi:hypothetical protein